jgi:hypothetical protein
MHGYCTVFLKKKKRSIFGSMFSLEGNKIYLFNLIFIPEKKEFTDVELKQGLTRGPIRLSL